MILLFVVCFLFFSRAHTKRHLVLILMRTHADLFAFDKETRKPLAFVHFRFEVEEEKLCLYWYA